MNAIQIFNNPQFGEIRVAVTENNEPMFCLADVCKALELANVSRVKSRLNSKGVTISDTLTTGGVQSMTYINEANLYKCIFQSRKPEAEKFQDWVCDEVLPSIRKTGGYSLLIPKTLSQALRLAAEQAEQIEEQQKLLLAQGEQIAEKDKAIAELHEKTCYLDQILNSKMTVATTQIAQDYGMSAKKFNVVLRNLKIQRKVGGQWILYAPHNTMGYVHSETFIPENSTTGKVIMVSRWTQKGRLFLYQILKKNNVLPLIER